MNCTYQASFYCSHYFFKLKITDHSTIVEETNLICRLLTHKDHLFLQYFKKAQEPKFKCLELSQHVKYFLHGLGILILELLNPLYCSSMLLQSHCPNEKMGGGGRRISRSMWFGWLGIRTNERLYLKNCESKTSIRGFLLTFTFVLWHTYRFTNMKLSTLHVKIHIHRQK